MEEKHVLLANNVRMPLLGVGTSHNQGGTHVDALVAAFRDLGYRLVDTAQRYGTEELVGEALAAAIGDGSDQKSLRREDFFVTTKLWPSYYGFDSTLEQVTLEQSYKYGTGMIFLPADIGNRI
jgi:2,5-diketo-D-gluconate reductase A